MCENFAMILNTMSRVTNIAKVKTAKSFGIDNISCYFLKLALPFIENSLAFMFNTSIQTSMFPDSWKIARVTPIYKNGDRTDESNYRPISVLPVISRLFEKLVTNQVYQHMEDNGLFSSGQSAYLRLHSTVTHLLKNTDDWYNGLDLGKLVGLVFIDLKKLLTLLTMRFSARKWCTTVSSSGNSHGLDHTCAIENSSAGSTVSAQN